MSNLKILVRESYELMSSRAASIIENQIHDKPDSVLGLATGSTPLGVYAEMMLKYKAGDTDFSRVRTFNLDEYYPIKKADAQSYYYYMRKNLFDFINIPDENIHIPDGEATDPNTECYTYEEKITALGGIDLQILGIGVNGHIGFNEPAKAFAAATHHVKLDASTIKENARFFANEKTVPTHALTMGIGTIMRATKIILLANGAKKAETLRDALYGPITPQNPASVLQLHRDVTVITDRDAGRLL